MNLTASNRKKVLTQVRHGLAEVPQPVPVPPRPYRRLLSVLLAGLALMIGVGLFYRDTLARLWSPPAPVVRTVAVRMAPLEQTIRLTGTTAAEYGALIRAPYLRGRRNRGGGVARFRLLLEELANPGVRVRQGDRIAVFDREYMSNQRDDIVAGRIEAETALRRLRAAARLKQAVHQQNLRRAKAEVDKALLDLKTAPVRSEMQVRLFNLALEEARATHEALQNDTPYVDISSDADIRIQEIELRDELLDEGRAQSAVDRMEVHAPIDGLVVIRDIRRGGQLFQVEAGDELRPGQPYMQIVDPDSIIVEAAANQTDINRLRVGAAVNVHFDAYPDLKLPGRLHSINPVLTSAGRRHAYVSQGAVTIELDAHSDPRVIPSMSVGADVLIGLDETAAIIPRDAVFYDQEDGEPFAYVQQNSGWEKRDLELGLRNHVAVSVESGLHEGEVVAVGEAPVTDQRAGQ